MKLQGSRERVQVFWPLGNQQDSGHRTGEGRRTTPDPAASGLVPWHDGSSKGELLPSASPSHSARGQLGVAQSLGAYGGL